MQMVLNRVGGRCLEQDVGLYDFCGRHNSVFAILYIGRVGFETTDSAYVTLESICRLSHGNYVQIEIVQGVA
jgi:hypothetical protein